METKSVVVPNTKQVEFTSSVNGRRYSVSIAFPLEPIPSTGSPVLYVLDGYAYFASATEAVRVNGNAPSVTVVGIGYPESASHVDEIIAARPPLPKELEAPKREDNALLLQRMYDLTLPVNEQVLKAEAGPLGIPLSPANVGGLDDFLQMIQSDIKPLISQLIDIDPSNQAIFGHSLGGLAVLHALFTMPDAYRSFVVASPSIWWGANTVLQGELKFYEAMRTRQACPRVLITVGADEDITDNQEIPGAHMVKPACELSDRLQELARSEGFVVEDIAVFPRQGHGISPWPAIGRAISFAFQ